MKQLQKQNFDKLLPLTKHVCDHRPIIFSVIEGTHPGSIYVDDETQPSYALVITKVNYLFVIGKLKTNEDAKALYSFIFNEMIPTMVEKEVVLFTDIKSNYDLIDEEFEFKGMINVERKLFELDEEQFKTEHIINDQKMKMVPLNQSLAKQAALPVDLCDFDTLHFGFALMKDDKVISTCYALFIGANEVEIDIKTEAEYRGKGYATFVARTFLNECLERGLKPNWTCWAPNQPSINLAEKVGFKELKTIRGHFWSENM